MDKNISQTKTEILKWLTEHGPESADFDPVLFKEKNQQFMEMENDFETVGEILKRPGGLQEIVEIFNGKEKTYVRSIDKKTGKLTKIEIINGGQKKEDKNPEWLAQAYIAGIIKKGDSDEVIRSAYEIWGDFAPETGNPLKPYSDETILSEQVTLI